MENISILDTRNFVSQHQSGETFIGSVLYMPVRGLVKLAGWNTVHVVPYGVWKLAGLSVDLHSRESPCG